jgi:hypothetical protein
MKMLKLQTNGKRVTKRAGIRGCFIHGRINPMERASELNIGYAFVCIISIFMAEDQISPISVPEKPLSSQHQFYPTSFGPLSAALLPEPEQFSKDQHK